MPLTAGTDYTAEYSNNTEVGTANVRITGIGSYTGERDVTFQIEEKPVDPPVTIPTTPGTGTPTTGTGTTSGTGSSTGTAADTPNTTAPDTPISPAAGTTVRDAASGANYKITKAGAAGVATVEYTKPVNSNKTSVTIPSVVTVNGVSCKVTSIAANAFKNSKKLKKVVIGSNVTAVGTNAFYGCKKLTNVTIGSNVTAIGAKAFYKCTALKKVTIPASVANIGKQAFYGCSKLKTITIKTIQLTTKNVGVKAFKGIYSKAAIKVPKKSLKAYTKLLKKKGVSSKARIKK